MTEYVVFGEVDGWHEAARVTARSASAAIKEAVDQQGDYKEGRFVAVPVRSWKPVTVKVETKTALKFS